MANELKTITCEKLMTTPLKPITYCVDGMLSTGLFILAGAPKIGKSWLALDIVLSIAKGEKVLEHETEQGTSLYLCLEDSYPRIQNRLFELTSEPTENLHIAIMADALGNGLENQIEKFKSEHTDLKIVVIDTLQKIRTSDDAGYASDYKELAVLKSLADKLSVTILLVHHTRKTRDTDPFNMISGTTGLSGCADGSMVMVEKGRGENEAKLFCVGRDIENLELHLRRDGVRWTVTDEIEPKPPDIFSFAVHDFMSEQKFFKGSATELVSLLKEKMSLDIPPNKITQHLVQHGVELKNYGVSFETKRSSGQRYVILNYDSASDSSDGKQILPKTAVPAVTEESKNLLTEPKERSDGSSESDSTAPKSDGF